MLLSANCKLWLQSISLLNANDNLYHIIEYIWLNSLSSNYIS